MNALLKLPFILVVLLTGIRPLSAQGTAFTYQGRLDSGGAPVNGFYDLRFAVYDSVGGGALVGGPLTNAAAAVSNGLFTITLDFGAGVFTGAERWLDIAVRTNGGGAFSTLVPRQHLTTTPYAIQSANAGSAAAVSGPVSAAQLTGLISSNNIGAGSITTTMLAPGAVGSSQLAPRAVTTDALADGAVTVAKISSVTEWSTLTFSNPTPATTTWFGRNLAAVGSDRVVTGTPYDNAVAENVGVAHLFSTDGTLITTFTNPAPAGYDYFGSAVAAVGSDRVLIGAMSDGRDTLRDGLAYLFSTEGTLLTTFTNPTPANGDLFGSGVGVVGSDRVLIGAFADDGGATNAGAAYLFSTNGALLTTFTNPTPTVDDWFGSSVAAVGSDRVLIGAYSDDTGATNAGVAYLFSTNGTLLTTFTNPTPAVDDWFGISVAAMGSDRVLIGAYGDNTGATNAGAAYLFSTNGTLLTTFTNPTPAVDDWFGISVAAMGSDRVLIGAYGDNTGAAHAGAVYLFNTNGTLITTFTNPTPATDDYFGVSVAAMGSDRVLASSINDDTGATNAGAAYLFTFETYTPGLVADGVRPHSVTMASLANGAVTTAGLADGAVTAVKIGGVLSASQIPDLDASKIASGVLDSNRIPALDAAKITTGALDANRIPALDAAKITSGVLNANRIPVLDASKITSGTLADARLSANVALRNGGNAFSGNQSINSGSLGIGTTSLSSVVPLHIYSAFTPTILRIQSGFQPGAGRLEFLSDPQGSANEWRPGYIESTDNGNFTGGLSFVVNGTGVANRFGLVETMRIVNGKVGIGTTTPVSALQVVGTVTATAFNPPSDRNLKENFQSVSSQEVLAKVAALPISRWNFKGDSATPHVGPMAQDFHAAFGLGTDDKHIATVDADGVALAAIQGLNQKLEQKETEITDLKQRLEKLERMMNQKDGGAR